MSDRKTIYLDDAIDAICKVCSMEEDYHKCDGYPEISTWCDNLVALRALPSAQPEQRWIPCSERLPENEEDSLVTDGESMAVGYYRQDAKAWDNADFGWIENRENGYGINEVIAWMPLPEPYKERREE